MGGGILGHGDFFGGFNAADLAALAGRFLWKGSQSAERSGGLDGVVGELVDGGIGACHALGDDTGLDFFSSSFMEEE